MLQALVNIFRIPELRNKVLFTIAMLAVYRIGFWIPVPGVDQGALKEFFEQQVSDGGAFGRVAAFVSVFSGGSFGQSTIFGLGIMPYISAAIIFQLLASAYEPIKKKQQEGPSGRQQVQEWTRYTTIALCVGDRLADVHHAEWSRLRPVAFEPGLVGDGCHGHDRRYRLPDVAR